MAGCSGQTTLLFNAARRCSGVLAVAIACGVAQSQEPELGFEPVALDRPSYAFDTAEQDGIRVDVVVRGLPRSFGFAFLPNGDALISERGARLRYVRNATSSAAVLVDEPVAGTPPPAESRGAGLHEVVVHPEFASNRLVYYTHNAPGRPNPSSDPTARPPTIVTLSRARLDGMRLTNVETVLVGEEQPGGSGSRVAFGPDGLLYMTTGAPFNDAAQSPSNVYGKILRVHDDGRIPADNPFVDVAGARGEVFTLGHRDQLGLTVHPSGAVLAAEHGPNGGDEVNLVVAGRNYGWPDYSFGRNYDGSRWSAKPLGADTEQPLVLWIPSIAPTGMTVYTGDRIPEWRGNLFVGSARRGEIPGTGGLERVVLNENLEELRRESLLTGLRARIRDVRQGPDGLLYVLTDDADVALLRIAPAH